MTSLAVKYRPTSFDNVVGQQSIIKILKRQLETNTFKNAYLFCGPSGDGKTTIARIFASNLNKGYGEPIEIDGASNNGVDNIRDIIESSKERSISSKYKIYIIDECHMITVQGWNAFLKCIEEPSPYTIFIFCTTDPQKIPATILNRVIRFNLTRIKTEDIKNRLLYICNNENYTNYEESCDYIAKLSCGGMRDAIAFLEKCSGYSNDLSIDNVLQSLGNFSYETFLDLTNSIIDRDVNHVINIIDDCYNNGGDLKLFINQYLDFILDLNKYCLFKDIGVTKLPTSLEKPKYQEDTLCVMYTVGIENNISIFNKLMNDIFEIKNALKYDSSPRTTISIYLMKICKEL